MIRIGKCLPRALAAILLTTAGAGGDDFCGTSRTNTEQLHEQYLRMRDSVPRARRAELATRGLRYDRGVLIVPRDELIAPNDHPFDLEGRSLVFTPRSGGGFTMESRPLEYEDERGDEVASFTTNQLTGATPHVEYTLTRFQFPFGSARRSQLYISGLQGIYFSPPPTFGTAEVHAVSAYGAGVPMIAPLLFGNRTVAFSRRVEIFVNETSSAATITWSVTGTRVKEIDIQATLFASGAVRYSYRKTANSPGGLVGLTTGDEAWRRDRTAVASFTDPSGDTSPAVPPAGAGSLDLISVAIQRVGGSNLLELTLRVRETIVIPPSPARLVYAVSANGMNVLSVTLRQSGNTLTSFARPAFAGDPALRVEGSTITMVFPEESLGAIAGRAQFSVSSRDTTSNATADFAAAESSVARSDQRFEIDLSAPPSSTTSRPVFETFTAPTLIPDAVADALLANDIVFDRINNIAIYQTFNTDLLYFASGYSTAGNPGDDNYAAHRSDIGGSHLPRTPALLHVNKVGYGYNSDPQDSFTLLAHEFAHHWLYEPTIVENGDASSVKLAPQSAHPAQYVDTRAAFPVYSPFDTSLMGGGYFTRQEDGSWSVPDMFTYRGLSWHELYLIGLAHPDEVPGWFYLDNTDPPLGRSYWPAPGSSVTGGRVGVTIDQLTASMGLRSPRWDGKPREYRALFVLVDRPEQPATDAEVGAVVAYRDRLEEKWAVATGGRSSIVSRLAWFAPELVAGRPRTLRFSDRSTVRGAEVEWDFGDGTTSAAREPLHEFAAAGTYDVSLTIRTPSGLVETSTRKVDVSSEASPVPPRRRAARR